MKEDQDWPNYMKKSHSIVLFNQKQIRRFWDEGTEERKLS
jgi:hypothetical protein